MTKIEKGFTQHHQAAGNGLRFKKVSSGISRTPLAPGHGAGFTLIELLVVIVIIGILATLATVTLSSARGKARDARRVSDVKQIQTALELYYNDAGGYPLTVDGPTAGTAFSYGGVTYMAKVPGNASPYNDGTCSAVQVDLWGESVAPDIYQYAQDTSGTSYHIHYCLGTVTGNIIAGNHHATPGSIQDP